MKKNKRPKIEWSGEGESRDQNSPKAFGELKINWKYLDGQFLK